MKRAFAPRFEQPGAGEPLEVVTQGGCRQVDLALDFTSRRATVAGLNDETKDRKTHGMAERAELLGVPVQFRRHACF